MIIERKIPIAFQDLSKASRYKIYYGGRGGGKSWIIAEELLFRGISAKLRILCARELQVSINDSVYRLLSDTINRYGLDGFYEVLQSSIRGQNGTEFLFKGMKHNATEIKSTEGVDICWVEEAEKVSERSWELLLPTIRKAGSEIWVTFNPKFPTDPTYQLFVEQRRDNAIVRKVSWSDNPWFPRELKDEMEHMKLHDPLGYEHIWEGNFDQRFSGCVYANWIAKRIAAGAVSDGGIYDPELPVHTAWDLGLSDSTSIWFWQVVGEELRLIDCYENNGQNIEHYCEVLKKRGYRYGDHYVPHDAAYKLLAAGGRSIVTQAYGFGVKMKVIPATSQQNGIEAARKVLETAYFDRGKCKDGLKALQAYEFQYDEQKQCFKTTPYHNWASHYCDSFEIIGQVMKNKSESIVKEKPKFWEKLTAKELFFPEKGNKDNYERI